MTYENYRCTKCNSTHTYGGGLQYCPLCKAKAEFQVKLNPEKTEPSSYMNDFFCIICQKVMSGTHSHAYGESDIKIKYKTMKVFNYQDLPSDIVNKLEQDGFFDNCESNNFYMDVHVYESGYSLDKWLIEHGANKGENVLLYISW